MQLIDIAQEEIEPLQKKVRFVDIPSGDIEYRDKPIESPLAKAGRIAGETINVLKEYVEPAIPVVKEGVDIANTIARKYLIGGRLPTMMTKKPGGFTTPASLPEALPPQDVAVPGPVMPAPEKVGLLGRASSQLIGMPTETIPSHEPFKPKRTLERPVSEDDKRKADLEGQVSKLDEFKKQINTEEKLYLQEIEQFKALKEEVGKAQQEFKPIREDYRKKVAQLDEFDKKLESMKVGITSQEKADEYNALVNERNTLWKNEIQQHPIFRKQEGYKSLEAQQTAPLAKLKQHPFHGRVAEYNIQSQKTQAEIDKFNQDMRLKEGLLAPSHITMQERTEQLRLAGEAKAKAPTISTLKEPRALERPRGYMELSLPELLGLIKREPKKITADRLAMEHAKDQNIFQIHKETNLPLSVIEGNYDDLTKELGIRTRGTGKELVDSLFRIGIGLGLITQPITTLVGVGSYMGVKEIESLATQFIKGEKPQFLAGRQLMEFLGPLEEHDRTIVEALEILAPGALSVKFMSVTKAKLTQKLKSKIITEAWDEAILKRAEAEKGRLLGYKPEIEGRPTEAPPGPELVSPIKPIQPKPRPIKPTEPVKPIIKGQEVPLEMVPKEPKVEVPTVKEKPIELIQVGALADPIKSFHVGQVVNFDSGLKGKIIEKSEKGLIIEGEDVIYNITATNIIPVSEPTPLVEGRLSAEKTLEAIETGKRLALPKPEPSIEAPKPSPEPQISRETAKYLELDQEFIDLRNRAIKGETLSDADLKRYEDLRIEVPYWMERAGISGKEVIPETKVEGIKPTEPLPEKEVSKEAMPVSEEGVTLYRGISQTELDKVIKGELPGKFWTEDKESAGRFAESATTREHDPTKQGSYIIEAQGVPSKLSDITRVTNARTGEEINLVAPPRVETVTAPSEARPAKKIVEKEKIIVEKVKEIQPTLPPLEKAELTPENIQARVSPEIWEEIKDLKDLRIEQYYETQVIKGERPARYDPARFVTHIFDAKTGRELGDYELGKIRDKVEDRKKYIQRLEELAKLPDVEPKVIEPPIEGKIETPKQQKKYLIDAIDEAIKDAPDEVEVIRNVFAPRVSAAGAGEIVLEKTPHVLIEVPWDGDFRVVNSKESLEGFKKLAQERFPGGKIAIKPTEARLPSEKPTGRRISPKDNPEYEYISEYSPKKVTDADYGIEKGDKVFVGEGWFTNGHFAVKGTAPLIFNKGTIQPFTKEKLKGATPSEKGMVKADYIAEFHLMGNALNGGMVVGKNTEALFNPAYMDIIKKYHPDSTVFFKDNTSPMLFKKGKETVGILMPMRLDVNIEPVREFLRSEGIKFPEEIEPPPEKTISQFTQEYKEGLGEGGFIKVGGIEKVTPKVVTPGTKDIPLISHPFEANFSSVPLMVADQHPHLAPIIKGNIKAEQDTNNWILRKSDKISEAFDKVEKPGLWMKVFGRKGTGIRDLDLMIEGKLKTPEELKVFIGEIKGILGDIKGEVIQKMKDDFAEFLSPKQKEYLDWVQGGKVGDEPVTTIAEYSYTNKKGNLITVPEHTRPFPQVTKDAVSEALNQFKEMEGWGIQDYFPHIFKGKYKYLTEDGHIIASGQTAKQAKANFVEYVESHPETTDKTFMFINDFYDLLTVRKVLNPELTSPLEYLGTRLSRKEFFRLLGRTEKVIKEEITNAGVDDIPKVKVDMSGIASFQKGTKFSGHFLKRKTSLRGEETDPFKALMSYVFSVGRKLGLEDAKKASYSFADSLPKNMPNAANYIKMQADNMSGRYNIIDKLFDETIGEKLGMKPFGLTRMFAKGVGLESKLKLGYALAKTAINYMGSVFHTVLKEGVKNFIEGGELVKKKDPFFMGKIEQEGHLAGMEQLFAGEGLVGISSKQTAWWRPLGSYQWAEVKGRTRALAAGYVSGLKKFGGDKDAAWIYAIDSARLTQGLYNIAAKPVPVRGPILQSSYQFKQYLANEIRFMSQLNPTQWAGIFQE